MVSTGAVAASTEENKSFDEIKEFLTTKKSTILNTLYIHGELSQGELAEKANTTVTALSNMLVKFDQFKYPLLTAVYKGRYRYYYLTDLALEYLEQTFREEQESSQMTLVSHEGARLAQEAQRHLLAFQNVYEDDWEIVLDDILKGYVQMEPVTVPEGEDLINQFMYCLECLIANEYYSYIEKTMALLKNGILQRRLEQFSQLYETTFKVADTLKDAEKVYHVFQILHMLIMDVDISNDALERLRWTRDYVLKLKEIVRKFVSSVNGWTEYDIFTCLKRYFTSQEQLCVFLAHDIYNA